MKFSKNSWHYKLLEYCEMEPYADEHFNLCPYTRRVIAALGLSAMGAIFLLVIGIIIAAFPIFVFGADIDIGMAFISSLLWVPLIYYCVRHWWFKDFVDEKVLRKKLDTVGKGPGLVKSYFKALHDKVCPPIEFTEDS